MLAGWFARRYFFSKKSHSVINLIAGVSVVSVAVPVAAMIVLLSVFNGFEQLVRSMNSHFDADLTLTPREGQTFGIESLDTAALRRLPGVEAESLALEQSALMEYRGRQAMVTVRGVADGYDRVVPVAECITAGDYAVRLGDLDRLVVGRGVAYELGLRSLGESDGVLYALRRTGFSSLLPVEGYTRRQAEVAGVFAADAQTDGRYLFTSLRLAQELFSYPDRASAAVVRVARGARPAEVKRRVAEAAGGAFEVRTRDELNASFYTIMAVREVGHLPHFAAGARHRLVLDRGDGGDARAGQAAGVRRTGRHGGRYAVRPPHSSSYGGGLSRRAWATGSFPRGEPVVANHDPDFIVPEIGGIRTEWPVRLHTSRRPPRIVPAAWRRSRTPCPVLRSPVRESFWSFQSM